MNGPFQTARELTTTALPAEFAALAPPPLLLPGEHLDHYHALRQAIFADLARQSAIEWLLAIDIAELSWVIQRNRMLRHKLLETSRQKAIAAALRHIDMAGIDPDFEPQDYTQQNALSWRTDPIAATEIEARLGLWLRSRRRHHRSLRPGARDPGAVRRLAQRRPNQAHIAAARNQASALRQRTDAPG
ncbi:hypothetical protein GGD65_002524 [Bradyrhizobium sp. CIR18]|uniref:hypothetical protein n=1 Tax=Bradyrhizobium sp. CIR18 TaxID=2663839 RepID=UPI001826DF18|nr:hypothetical protein [Bradyrhizobium sp. CIR18]MBB4361502.1 hypothetical protein [Bradyrhizobium sp. CIR18]